MQQNKIKVGIVGGTGYTGVELLRLLALHPGIEIACITSRGEAGQRVSDMFPSLRGYVDLPFTDPAQAATWYFLLRRTVLPCSRHAHCWMPACA